MDEIKYIVDCLNNGKMPTDDIGTELGDYLDSLSESFYLEAQERQYIDEYGDTNADEKLIIISAVKLEKDYILETLDLFMDISEEGESYLLSNLKYDEYYFVQYWEGVLDQYTDDCYWHGIYYSEDAAKEEALKLIPSDYVCTM